MIRNITLLVIGSVIVAVIWKASFFNQKTLSPESFVKGDASVTQIGVDLGNSFSGVSRFFTNNKKFTFLPQESSEELKRAIDKMPLIVNRQDLDPELNQRLKHWPQSVMLFIGRDRKLYLYDLDSFRLFVSYEIPSLYNISSNGFLDIKRATVYWQTVQGIYSYVLGADSVQYFKKDWESLVKQADVSWDIFKNGHWSCNTAVKVLEIEDKSYLLWGCSTPDNYGKHPGASGFVAKTPLMGQGKVLTKQSQIFFTSKKAEEKFSGTSTGIWNNGTGLTVVDNNQILLATGNGYYRSEFNNYGCSVLMLDGRTWTLPKGFRSHFSFSEPGYTECLFMNLDLGATNVTSLSEKGKSWAFLKWSGGYAATWSPATHLPEFQEDGSRTSYWMNPLDFGTWPVYSVDGAVYSIGVTSRNSNSDDSLILPEAIFQKLSYKEEYKRGDCVGVAPKTTSSTLHTLYSGRRRRKFVFLEEDHPYYKILTSDSIEDNDLFKVNHSSNDYWAAYRDEVRLRNSFTFLKKKLKKSYESDVEFLEVHLVHFRRYQSLQMKMASIEEWKRNDFEGVVRKESPLGSILRKKSEPRCHGFSKKEFVRLYKYAKKKTDSYGSWNVVRYVLNSKGKLKPEVLFQGSEPLGIPHSNPVVYQGAHSGVFIFVLTKSNGESV
ncbi:MAG: hypothetical protein KDD61_13735, partial [Bdellovibrionales bacterium]|nr:hypothetical protein [Bdellovibrionales bacterium]